MTGRDEAKAYLTWIVELFGDVFAGSVLDHGAGTGALSARLLGRAERVFALEPEPILFEGLRQRFAHEARVTPVPGTIDDYLASYGAGSLQAVLSSNVLEHLADDVSTLRRIREALEPGGALAIYVPARQELFGSLDESVGHLRRYSRSSLRRALTEAGFRVEWVRYRNLAGVLPWLVAGRVLRRHAIAGGSLRWFDRYVFPAARLLEARLALPYGLNVAALARRQ
jgi:SAM-dependent methyltransferase